MANLLAALMTILASVIAYIFIDFKKMVRDALAAHTRLMESLQKIIDDCADFPEAIASLKNFQSPALAATWSKFLKIAALLGEDHSGRLRGRRYLGRCGSGIGRRQRQGLCGGGRCQVFRLHG